MQTLDNLHNTWQISLSIIPLLGMLAPLLGGLLGGGGAGGGIGGLLSGLFGGGAPAEAPKPPQEAQRAAQSPDMANIAMMMSQLGGARGADGGAGVLGAVLPSLAEKVGSGKTNLADSVGAATAGAFLANQLAAAQAARREDPQAQAGLQEVGRNAAQAATSRRTVNDIQAALGPELAGIRQMAQERANQVQATSEHREIIARQQFRREVLRRLATIESNGNRGANRRY